MPVVKTTSPVACASRAAGVAVEAGAVLEQHVGRLRGARHRTSFWMALNSWRAGARRSSSNSAVSAVVGTTRRSSPSSPGRSSRSTAGREADGVDGDVHLAPRSSSRSWTVWRDAHVRLDAADEHLVAAVEVEALGARGGEHRSSRCAATPSRCAADLGHGVAQAASGTARWPAPACPALRAPWTSMPGAARPPRRSRRSPCGRPPARRSPRAPLRSRSSRPGGAHAALSAKARSR